MIAFCNYFLIDLDVMNCNWQRRQIQHGLLCTAALCIIAAEWLFFLYYSVTAASSFKVKCRTFLCSSPKIIHCTGSSGCGITGANKAFAKHFSLLSNLLFCLPSPSPSSPLTLIAFPALFLHPSYSCSLSSSHCFTPLISLLFCVSIFSCCPLIPFLHLYPLVLFLTVVIFVSSTSSPPHHPSLFSWLFMCL